MQVALRQQGLFHPRWQISERKLLRKLQVKAQVKAQVKGLLVTAQVTSAVIGTSVGKIFAVANGAILGVCIGLSVVTAVVNVGSLMMAASNVNQGIFVPLQTCATLGTNMVTGLLIWEDATVVTQWFAYVALYWLMGLGIYMLTSADLLELYVRRKRVRPARSPP